MHRPASLLVLLALILLQSALFFGAYRTHGDALVDDAYISFRYAQRWADGDGLTWNDGERVEGFSNPLWTLGLGLLARTGWAPQEAAPMLGFLAALGAVVAVAGLAGALGGGAGIRLLAGAGLALDLGLAVWAGSGLETSLAALLLALFLRLSAAHRPGVGAGIGMGLLASGFVLVRPEGAAWGLGGLIWLVWGAWVPGRVLAAFAAGLVPAAAYLVFRFVHFGRLVPNTFFAKLEPSGSGLDDGFLVVGTWILAHALPLVAVLMASIRRGLVRRPAAGPVGPVPWVWLPVGLLVWQCAFVIAAGGDWMGRMRYLAPLLPALYGLLAANLIPFEFRRPPLRWIGATALVVHLALGWTFRDRIPTYTREGRAVGEWLRSVALPGESVAVTAAGAIPYYSGLPALDILGINDAGVASWAPRHAGAWAPGHHRYDLERLLDLEPEWIVWDFGVKLNRHRWRTYESWPVVDRERLDYRRELFAHRRFTRDYVIDTSAPGETQSVYTVFRKKQRRPVEGGGS